MPNYKTSTGEVLKKSVIDRRISEAKEDYIENFRDVHNYFFCERTKRSDLGLDCSHIISVKECQESGRSELAYSKNNLELLSRDAHNQIESMSKNMREEWFHRRKEGMTFENFKLFNNL